jgi:hypothetical protein
MKKLLATIAFALALTSCDKLEDPVDVLDTKEEEVTIEGISHDGDMYVSDAVIYLPFNNDYLDYGIYSLIGRNHNTTFTTDRFGNENSAVKIELEQYIDFEKPPILLNETPGVSQNFDFRDDFGISMWVKIDSREQLAYETHIDILSKWIYPADKAAWYFGITQNGSYEFWSRSDKKNGFVGYENPMYDGLWHNIIYNFDHITQIGKIYVDGELASSSSTYLPVANNLSLRVGARHDLKSDFNGYVDDVMFFDRQLNLSDMANLITE